VDEAQNLRPLDVKTIVTRAGEGTKIVLTGDLDQIDQALPRRDVERPLLPHQPLHHEENFCYLNLAMKRPFPPRRAGASCSRDRPQVRGAA